MVSFLAPFLPSFLPSFFFSLVLSSLGIWFFRFVPYRTVPFRTVPYRSVPFWWLGMGVFKVLLWGCMEILRGKA